MTYEARFSDEAQKLRTLMFAENVGTELKGIVHTDPELAERFENFAFGEVPEKADFGNRNRGLCWLATLLGCQGIDLFCEMLPAIMNLGVTPVEVKEVVYQAVDYLGMGRVFPFISATAEIFEKLGIADNEELNEPRATTTPDFEDRVAKGEQTQVEIFGERMVGFASHGNPEYPHINQWLAANCFGDFYTRKGLNHAEREMVTFCYIAAQGGADSQLRSHCAGNISVGNSKEFLIKVISNNLPLIGYPRSLNAFAALEAATKAA